jgi:hypothetical protein
MADAMIAEAQRIAFAIKYFRFMIVPLDRWIAMLDNISESQSFYYREAP